MNTEFEQPYFIPKHAVQRFQERVANIPRDDVLVALQAALQASVEEAARLHDEGLMIVRSARCNGKKIYVPTLYTGKPGEWPVALTVEIEGQNIYWRLLKHNGKRRKPQPWTAEDNKLLKLLRQRGYSIRECAHLMGRGHTTIHRYLDEPKRQVHRWSEKEKEYAIRLRSMGKSYEAITKKINKQFETNRTVNAIEIFFSRHRKMVRDDPKKQAALKVLSFCMNPGKVLSAARKHRLIDDLLEEESGL